MMSNEESGNIIPTTSQFSRHYNTPDSFREGFETRDEYSDTDTVKLFPELFTRQYNTPDKFRQGLESRDVNMIQKRKQTYMSPDEILHELNDNNEIPGDSPGMLLGLGNGRTIPEDENIPEEFRSQEGGKSHSRLSPELEELENVYYDTNSGFSRVPAMEIVSENDNQKQRGESEGKAYTEGGLVYLPKQNRGKKGFPMKHK
jgi:hypothetical protein